jgi:predicted transcriptional regulator
MPEKYQLTPVEHELMEILWKLGQGTVRDVIACLPPNRHLAYTSVSTILRILQQKKIITAEKIGKQHIYLPVLSKEKYAAHSLNTMVKHVFSGNSVNLVAYLVNQQDLSLEEIDRIQKLLDSRKKELAE